MSQSQDLVIAYLELLHKHRELIAAAYHTGSVTRSDEARTVRGIGELQQRRTLVPLTRQDFRLATSLVRHLDEVLQKEQLYAAVGAQTGELVERLRLLGEDALQAHREGRSEDVDTYADQFSNAVFELADSLELALQHLRVLADNRFANVSTLAEKRRQNEYYIGRAERIGQTLTALASDSLDTLLTTLADSPACESLARVFRSQISERLPEWRALLLDITAILKTYLYRLRQIEPAARRLRAFALFLRRNPDYSAPAIDELAEVPAHLGRPLPLRLSTRADVDDAHAQETLIAIACHLPKSRGAVQRTPRVGCLDAPDEQQDRTKVIALRPMQRAWQQFLHDLATATQPLSALVWKRAHPEWAALPDDIWLLCVLHEVGLSRRRTHAYRFERIEAPTSLLAGNIVVQDVRVYPRPLSLPAPEYVDG